MSGFSSCSDRDSDAGSEATSVVSGVGVSVGGTDSTVGSGSTVFSGGALLSGVES